MKLFPLFVGFDWDEGNRNKNWNRHNVAWWECEEVFFNQPLYVASDPRHSLNEERFYALGATSAGRYLSIVFTRRKSKLRIVTARDMSRKERKVYLEKAENDSNI
jgi:uncharacterized protein